MGLGFPKSGDPTDAGQVDLRQDGSGVCELRSTAWREQAFFFEAPDAAAFQPAALLA